MRVGPLQFARQVDPQLDAVEQAAGHHQVFRGSLDMQNAVTGGHVLRPTFTNGPTAAVRVLMQKPAINQIGERFKAAVRMPGCAFRLTGGILHLAHLIHHDERINIAGIEASERPTDRKSLALERLRRSSHGFSAPRSGCSGHVQPRQGEGVSGDCGHGYSSLLISSTNNRITGASIPRICGEHER